MKPTEFKEQNVIFAKDQPEYQPLPALRDDTGAVVTCWKLSLKERLKLLFTGKIWHCAQTFNNPLQPMYFTTIKSELIEKVEYKPD